MSAVGRHMFPVVYCCLCWILGAVDEAKETAEGDQRGGDDGAASPTKTESEAPLAAAAPPPPAAAADDEETDAAETEQSEAAEAEQEQAVVDSAENVVSVYYSVSKFLANSNKNNAQM